MSASPPIIAGPAAPSAFDVSALSVPNAPPSLDNASPLLSKSIAVSNTEDIVARPLVCLLQAAEGPQPLEASSHVASLICLGDPIQSSDRILTAS